MRFVVFGAGAVGGVVAGRLAESGHDVALIARGRHGEAIRAGGLLVESPDRTARFDLPVFDSPSHISWSVNDVVLLAVKSQDTAGAIDALAGVAHPGTPVVCLQNGVANERIALRRCGRVYGVFVYCPTAHVRPGVVQAWYSPVTGILDIGRYPSGSDRTADEVAAAFRRATFHSETRADIMRWKYRKLLMNLGNAVEALCGLPDRSEAIISAARLEAIACLEASGHSYASDDEEPVRREKELRLGTIGNARRPGGSTWQSLARGAMSTEVDYLNGEIVLLGRTHGIATPVNETLQRLMRVAVRAGAAPGSMTIEELTAQIERR
jgi:2-dehydropantoate 2-reductase